MPGYWPCFSTRRTCESKTITRRATFADTDNLTFKFIFMIFSRRKNKIFRPSLTSATSPPTTIGRYNKMHFLKNLPCPILVLFLSTDSGGLCEGEKWCWVRVANDRPVPSGTFQNTFTDFVSTGNSLPTRCDSSQYATLHHSCSFCFSIKKKKKQISTSYRYWFL